MIGLLLLLWGCWAPDLAAPIQEQNTTQSPMHPSPNMDDETHEEARMNAPNSNYSDEEHKELSTQAPLPPYTAWTIKENASILGPNGGAIFAIPKIGTRVEVQKVVPQYAQVLCSGCAPPKQNQAGWINIEDIRMEWDMPENDPLLTMITLRREWLKNNNTPKELTDRRSICMLFDNGYIESDSGVLWSIQGGEIRMELRGSSWIVTSTQSPHTPPASSWRCDSPKTPSTQ